VSLELSSCVVVVLCRLVSLELSLSSCVFLCRWSFLLVSLELSSCVVGAFNCQTSPLRFLVFSLHWALIQWAECGVWTNYHIGVLDPKFSFFFRVSQLSEKHHLISHLNREQIECAECGVLKMIQIGVYDPKCTVF